MSAVKPRAGHGRGNRLLRIPSLRSFVTQLEVRIVLFHLGPAPSRPSTTRGLLACSGPARPLQARSGSRLGRRWQPCRATAGEECRATAGEERLETRKALAWRRAARPGWAVRVRQRGTRAAASYSTTFSGPCVSFSIHSHSSSAHQVARHAAHGARAACQPAVEEQLNLLLALLPRVGTGSRWCPGPREEEGLKTVDVDHRTVTAAQLTLQRRMFALGLGQAVTVKGPSHRGRSIPSFAAAPGHLP